MTKLTQKDIEMPNYLNTNPVGSIAGNDIYLSDVDIAGVFAGLNGHYRGPKSAGKTQLMRDIFNCFFAGENQALWDEGRSDYKPKDLFERLNISLARGASENLPEIKAVYANEGVNYLVRSCVEKDGEIVLSWKPISKQEKEKLETELSLTTDDLKELRNVDKKFFCIDEYTRCPEVVMNLFYGLMNGEIKDSKTGKILKLGNGYYAGRAASNPDDYEGTFKMDKAMWARYHVVIDFGAYPNSPEDKDELKKRNCSAGVQECEKIDRTAEIEEIYQRVKNSDVSLKERIILSYFEVGLDSCVSQNKSKEIIDWPRTCDSKNCAKKSMTCGVLKALDERSARAVFRLAKGLEEVLKIKGYEELVDPVETFVLAYEFVAPYKGGINPKKAKEKKSIEALVIRDVKDAMKKNLSEKLSKMENLARREAMKYEGKNNAHILKKEFEKANANDKYAEIEQEIRKKYESSRSIMPEEFAEMFSAEIRERENQLLLEQVAKSINDYEQQIFECIGDSDKENYNTMQELSSASKWSKKQYKNFAGKTEGFEEFINKATSQLSDALKMYAEALVQEDDSFKSVIYAKSRKNKEFFRSKAEEQVKSGKNPENIKFMPRENILNFKKELVDKLIIELKQINAKNLESEKEGLFKEEWQFLKRFYPEFLEEVKPAEK